MRRAKLAVPPHTGATARARVICSKRTKALAAVGASTQPALQNALQWYNRPRRYAMEYESLGAARLADCCVARFFGAFAHIFWHFKWPQPL